MTMDRHDTIGAMLDEYALGQLSQDERRDVETHVRECDVCAADLREFRIVMEGLESFEADICMIDNVP